MRTIALLTLLCLTAACSDDPIVVGSKVPAQDLIMAEMFALLIEQEGLPVERRLGLGESYENFEALRSGVIDVYPEYTGTGLALLGRPALADPPAALEVVREDFAELGMIFLDGLGFESTFELVVRRDTAARYRLEGVSDLRAVAPQLRLGVEADFAGRPRDGLQPFLDRFGLEFEAVDIVDAGVRPDLYGRLIQRGIDVAVGFSTDPEIGDYGLVAIAVRQPFFPAYEAAPLVSENIVAAQPRVGAALERLGGKIDEEMMRRLVRKVQVLGHRPRAVAAEALAELGLIEAEEIKPRSPLTIAANPAELGGRTANTVLRAVREAVPGREISFRPALRPVDLVIGRESRLALVPGISHFEVEGGVFRNEAVETIAAIDSSYVYALALRDGPSRLMDAEVIATGPRGSASYKIATVIGQHSDPSPVIVPLETRSPEEAVRTLSAGKASAILIVGERWREDIVRLLRDGGQLQLIDAVDWWEGPARLALPFLREAILSRETDNGSWPTVRTLAMQNTLIGPAGSGEPVLGQSGPSTYSNELYPVSDRVVLAINAALGPHPDVGPHLRRAAALKPKIRPITRSLNPDMSHAFLLAGILAFLAWAGWLFVRSPRG